MFIGLGNPIPRIANLPGASRPGGGGGGGGGLAQVDNLYSYEFDEINAYFDAGNITALNSQSAFSTSARINYSGTPTTSSHVILSGGSSSTNKFWVQLKSSTVIKYGSGSASAYDVIV